MELLLNNLPIASESAIEEWQGVEFACDPPPATALALLVGDVALEPFLRPGETRWRWRWNPQNSVGLVRLALRATPADGSAPTTNSYSLRVAPRKLAQEHYALLLDHLQRDAAALVAALGGGAEGATIQRQPAPPHSALESYAAWFGERLDSIERAVLRASQRPHSALLPHSARVPLGAATTLDGAALADLAAQPLDPAPPEVAPELQELLAPEGGFLPRDLAERQSAPSYDTPENRLVRDLVDELLRRARQIGRIAQGEAARLERNEQLLGPTPALVRIRAVAAGCGLAERRLRRLRALPFVAEARAGRAIAAPASKLLQRDPAYRQLYGAWRDLRGSSLLALESPLFHLPIQELPALYEIWCAAQVALALLALPEWSAEGDRGEGFSLPTNEAGLQFRVQEDVPLLRLRRGEEHMTLRYQARYRPRRANSSAEIVSLDRHTRVPDLAIELRRPGEQPAVVVLDAKYRLDGAGGVPEDALADAYAYRGSIGHRDGGSAVVAAVLLYPGTGRPEIYPSGVGALPLLPGSDGELRRWLAGVIPPRARAAAGEVGR